MGCLPLPHLLTWVPQKCPMVARGEQEELSTVTSLSTSSWRHC